MGMMDAQPMQQPVPEQGMMGGTAPVSPSLSHGKFSGEVNVNGKPVMVQGGTAIVEGAPYTVSDDGAMVVDGKGILVGHVEGKEFVPIDQHYLKLMQGKGYVR